MSELVGNLGLIATNPSKFQSSNNVIYQLLNRINNKCYIGQARELFTRILWDPKSHINTYFNYDMPRQYLYRALHKYGLDNFDLLILERVASTELLNSREKYWIRYYQSNHRDHGYNMTSGGESADQLNTESSIKKRCSTIIAKYGTSYNHQNNDEVKLRAHEASIRSKLSKYGCAQGILSTPESLEKAKQSLIDKYGSVDAPLRTEDALKKLRATMHHKTFTALIRICKTAELNGVSQFKCKSEFMKYHTSGISDYRKSVIMGFFTRAVELNLIDDDHKYLASFFRNDWLPDEFIH